MRSPVFKQTARTKQYGGATKEIQNAVGAGALDSPLYINVFSGRRRRRPLPRSREIHLFVQIRKKERTTLRAIQYSASLHGTLASQVCDRPYRLYFVPHRRGGFHIRPHKINGENKQYGGAPTPTHIVGTGVLDCPLYVIY